MPAHEWIHEKTVRFGLAWNHLWCPNEKVSYPVVDVWEFKKRTKFCPCCGKSLVKPIIPTYKQLKTDYLKLVDRFRPPSSLFFPLEDCRESVTCKHKHTVSTQIYLATD